MRIVVFILLAAFSLILWRGIWLVAQASLSGALTSSLGLVFVIIIIGAMAVLITLALIKAFGGEA